MDKEVKVTWVDSSSFGGAWMDKDEIKNTPMKYCQTLGFLIYEDDNIIKVAQSISEDLVMNIMIIPKVCIKSFCDTQDSKVSPCVKSQSL